MSSAVKKYLDFTGFKDFKVTELNLTLPKELIKIGECDQINYVSDKWDGTRRFYFHTLEKFGNLYIDPSGKIAIITGLNLKIKPEGLIG